jgi:hypothetical protein
MMVIILLCVLIFPLTFLLGLKPAIIQVIASSAFGLASILTVLILIGAKLHQIYFKKASKIAPLGVGTTAEPAGNAGGAVVASDEVLRKYKTYGDRITFVRDQIERWKVMEMKLLESDSKASSKASLLGEVQSSGKSFTSSKKGLIVSSLSEQQFHLRRILTENMKIKSIVWS